MPTTDAAKPDGYGGQAPLGFASLPHVARQAFGEPHHLYSLLLPPPPHDSNFNFGALKVVRLLFFWPVRQSQTAAVPVVGGGTTAAHVTKWKRPQRRVTKGEAQGVADSFSHVLLPRHHTVRHSQRHDHIRE